jgi:class 3 adenylate cyclase
VYLSILTNGAIAMASSGNTEEAIALFYFILSESRRVEDHKYTQKSLINLATVMWMLEQNDSVDHYLRLAEKNVAKTDEADAYLTLLLNMAILDMEDRRFKQARIRFDSVESLAIQLNEIETRAYVLKNRAVLAKAQHQYPEAYEYLHQYLVLHDSILDQTRIKAVTDMQEKYESEKKVRQIQQLEIANLDANLNNERIRHTRNRYLYAGAGVLLLSFGLLGRLQYVRRAKRAIQKEKDISEGLLLNILPAAVADELKAKGAAEAKLYEQATILFSDFKSFTEVAETMSAAELVDEINTCFKAFDEITAKYGLEKIKTIGDSYMAAGAVPDNNQADAAHVVQAALAMQDFIIARKKERDVAGQHGFEMRIGIHTGPVVAGIVGIKKFQYDLWGDTVNIASRMETASEPGEVNISETTYSLVKDKSAFRFTDRGMIHAKGKGEMAMYFVRRAGG